MNTKPHQPSLAELTDRLLQRRAAEGIDTTETEVEPHEVLNGFRTEPRTAYADAVLPLTMLGVKGMPSALPPEWIAFVNADLGTVAVPMAAGHFPQQVRDLDKLLTTPDLTTLAPKGGELHGFSSLRAWAYKNRDVAGLKWLTRGVDRLLGVQASVSEEASAVAQNEAAAEAWMTGRHAEAVELWQAMPDSPVAAFNVGMSLLFLGKAKAAIFSLRKAADALPDSCGWHHLAQLYLSVAESRCRIQST